MHANTYFVLVITAFIDVVQLIETTILESLHGSCRVGPRVIGNHRNT
jgi:hypothetical protein